MPESTNEVRKPRRFRKKTPADAEVTAVQWLGTNRVTVAGVLGLHSNDLHIEAGTILAGNIAISHTDYVLVLDDGSLRSMGRNQFEEAFEPAALAQQDQESSGVGEGDLDAQQKQWAAERAELSAHGRADRAEALAQHYREALSRVNGHIGISPVDPTLLEIRREVEEAVEVAERLTEPATPEPPAVPEEAAKRPNEREIAYTLLNRAPSMRRTAFNETGLDLGTDWDPNDMEQVGASLREVRDRGLIDKLASVLGLPAQSDPEQPAVPEHEPCERCGDTGIDPAGATPGAACILCEGAAVPEHVREDGWPEVWLVRDLSALRLWAGWQDVKVEPPGRLEPHLSVRRYLPAPTGDGEQQ